MGKGRRRSRDFAVEPDDVAPVDVDGVRTVAVLTVVWAVAFVILAFRKDSLDAAGHGWWLWTCLAGVGLGLLGLEYTRKRRDAIELAQLRAEAAADDAPPLDGVSAPAGAADSPASTAVTRPIDTSGVILPGRRSDEPDQRRQPPDQPVAQDLRVERRRSGAAESSAWPVDPQAEADEQSSPASPLFPSAPSPWPSGQPGQSGGQRPAPESDLLGRPDLEPPARRPVDAPGPSAAVPRSRWDSPDQRDVPNQVDLPEQRDLPDERDLPDQAEPTPRDQPDAHGDPSDRSSYPVDDEPLLDTTLGGGRRARRYDTADETDDGTEGGGQQYRGRRARRSDSA